MAANCDIEYSDIRIGDRFRRCEVVAPLERGPYGESRILALHQGRPFVAQLWPSEWRAVPGDTTLAAVS